ncbi:MAG: KpsF/GutQ family sugar-phosphate isomerase [Planctomycetota bacterium]|jgi:arabinose-5-phosphate isomerase
MDNEEILRRSREIFEIEAQAIRNAAAGLDEDFVKLVQGILDGKGKVLTSGVGKSGIVAKKIAATLSSTGTPSVYLNPVNALHGDLGIVDASDILLALSNSGETQEILNFVRAAGTLGVKIAAFSGTRDSTLMDLADFRVYVGVAREACPLGLAPTASTTASLAAGDALAMVLMEARSFQPQDFMRLHPAGTLRTRLELKVRDIMRVGEQIPLVEEDATFAAALQEMTEKDRLGVTLIAGKEGRLCGILTDGDLRRFLLLETDPGAALQKPVKDRMTKNPKVVDGNALASEAVRIMEVKGITSLAIVDTRSRPVGLIHLHDILGRGQFSV